MEKEVEEEGKNAEWIWLWEALSTCVPDALCALARAIRGYGKKVGSASRKPRSADSDLIGARHR